jgi:uncharacterized YigZ family protein
VTSEEEARAFIQRCRKRHYDARHHCTAYVIGDNGETQKSSDDGEPAGTAGVPMLDVLRRNEITNTVAVVSRYFGGVLLGAGGLVRAYAGAVSGALDGIGLVERRPARIVSITTDHAVAGKLENDLRSAGYAADVRYTDRVRFDLRIPESSVPGFETWLAEATAGTVSITLGERAYIETEI